MNEQIKTRWIEALLSGKYKQGHGKLCDGKMHCALGVLCEIAAAEEKMPDGIPLGRKLITRDDGARAVSFNGRSGMLPPQVARWAGVKACNLNTEGKPMGVSLRGKYGDRDRDIIQDNDEGKSFKEIAAIIEENWRVM